jgi:putative acetyltransferase
MNLVIRNEQPQDVKAIEEVTQAAFKDVEYSSHTEQFIVRELRNRNVLTVSLVAEIDGKIVGHVAISPVQLSSGDLAWYGLGPISVLPSQQCKGIGHALMTTAIEVLKVRNSNGCVLLGDPNYYGKFGFKAVPNLILEGVPPEYFQAISFVDSFPNALVSYDKAFEVTE